jgi:CubicO group peptidase (beta-lactamase class C family)
MKKIVAFMVFIFILQSGLLFAQDPVKRPNEAELKIILSDFDEYASKAMTDWKIPGMAIGIVDDGRLILAKGYGVKTLGGQDPVTQDTIFQIGSTSKAFTAALVAMLVDEGKLKWDDKVVDHAPDFMMYDPWVTREFQIVDLLSQRSGMPAYAGDALYAFGFDRAYIKRVLRNIKPVTSFRSKYAYQNTLWLVAADIIEKHNGKTWEESLASRIFLPLGMNASSADKKSFLQAGDVSSMHAQKDGKVIALPKNWEFLDWSYVAGPAGGINSNITDMAKWLTLQMNNGKANGKPLVSEENMKIVHSPKLVTSLSGEVQKNAYYCLGWVYLEHAPYPVILHDGATMMKTMVAYVPEQKIGIIIMSNYVTDLPALLAFRFIDQFSGKPVKDLSADALAELEKIRKRATSVRPVKPKSPSPPMPAQKYAGDYISKVYGTMKISIQDEKLVAVIGPSEVKIGLVPWDKDTFSLDMISPVYDPEIDDSFAIFQIDPRGDTTSVTFECLNQGIDLGVFRRVQKEKPEKK